MVRLGATILASFVVALSAFVACDISQQPPGAAEFVEAGMDPGEVYERCASSEFGWCQKPAYSQWRKR